MFFERNVMKSQTVSFFSTKNFGFTEDGMFFHLNAYRKITKTLRGIRQEDAKPAKTPATGDRIIVHSYAEGKKEDRRERIDQWSYVEDWQDQLSLYVVLMTQKKVHHQPPVADNERRVHIEKTLVESHESVIFIGSRAEAVDIINQNPGKVLRLMELKPTTSIPNLVATGDDQC